MSASEDTAKPTKTSKAKGKKPSNKKTNKTPINKKSSTKGVVKNKQPGNKSPNAGTNKGKRPANKVVPLRGKRPQNRFNRRRPNPKLIGQQVLRLKSRRRRTFRTREVFNIGNIQSLPAIKGFTQVRRGRRAYKAIQNTPRSPYRN